MNWCESWWIAICMNYCNSLAIWIHIRLAYTIACQYVHEYARSQVYTYIYIYIYRYIRIHEFIQTCKQRAACFMTSQKQQQQHVNMYTNMYVHDVHEYLRTWFYMYVRIQTCKQRAVCPMTTQMQRQQYVSYVHKYVRTRCIRIYMWTSLCVHIYTYMYMYVYKPANKELRAPWLPRCNHHSMSCVHEYACTRCIWICTYTSPCVHVYICKCTCTYTTPQTKSCPMTTET